MSAVEDRLPAVTDETNTNDAACAEALAALEAELALWRRGRIGLPMKMQGLKIQVRTT